jgi:hypothetical protein
MGAILGRESGYPVAGNNKWNKNGQQFPRPGIVVNLLPEFLLHLAKPEECKNSRMV